MILVTGGTGLLGSHLLLDLFKSGRQVRAIKPGKPGFGEQGLEILLCELCGNAGKSGEQ